MSDPDQREVETLKRIISENEKGSDLKCICTRRTKAKNKGKLQLNAILVFEMEVSEALENYAVEHGV